MTSTHDESDRHEIAPLLSLDRVSVRYGHRPAVESLDLSVRPGEIFGLLGPNGSGKSSTLAAIAGTLEPASGTITVAGTTRKADPLGYAPRIGYLPQEPALYDELSIRDNLRFFGSLYDLPSGVLNYRVARCLERLGLTDRARCRVGTLSGGLRRRTHFAVALLHDPKLLLLDEPTVAMDGESRERVNRLLCELRDEGRAVLVSTHLLEEAELICDRVAVLREGRLVAMGRPGDLGRQVNAGPERSLMYGYLRDRLAPDMEAELRTRLPIDVDFEVTGRRVRLGAPDSEQLGLALAVLMAEGATLESFRTPPGRLDRLLSSPEPIRSVPCDVRSV